LIAVPTTSPKKLAVVVLVVTALIGACGAAGSSTANRTQNPSVRRANDRTSPPPGGPPPLGTPAPAAAPSDRNIYANDGPNMLSPATAGALYRIYVPNSESDSVDVIDPATLKVVNHFKVGHNPQHVVPSWDLKTLYVTNDLSNTLTPIDPTTSERAPTTIPAVDPYNMYFTPDGASAIIVAEAQRRLDFVDPHTFALQESVPVQCGGVDHIDFAADLSYLIATCEFSGQLLKLDLKTRRIVGYLSIGGMPQDIKLDPAGQVFYVADMVNGGVHEIDGDSFTKIGFLATGPETHGLYPSRDAKDLYVANRGGRLNQGSVSVVDFSTRQVVATWPVPGGGTPDMGGVSPDGKVLWLSGRRSREIYAFDTTTGTLLARIRVGTGPHGLCVWPQPGTYSLGHTGILR
jgi:YVTN family beta-propeller protein